MAYAINTNMVLVGNSVDSIRRLLERGLGGGSGSDTGTHRRLDSLIRGDLNGFEDSVARWSDTTGVLSAFAPYRDTNQGRIDSFSLSIKSLVDTSKPCWSCLKFPPETLSYDFNLGMARLSDTVVMDINVFLDSMPFDFMSLLRWVEWISIIVLLTPSCIYIMRENNA
jgi:hypothetical protein